jgi:CRISPR-associated RAMP protein (TIGR02581 family)
MFTRKVRITGKLIFETAFRIGSGLEGELASDMGILKESDGRPILPGSTLKGNFRSLAERLSDYLGFTACLLDSELSGIDCVSSDEKFRKRVYNKFKDLKKENDKISWLSEHTCRICRLFGSPLQASRIFFSDGKLKEWGRSIQIRDGVCIDRDSETAVPRAKYNFEAVPADTVFSFSIDIENPDNDELGLIAAVISEWENGFRLGGFTSRGLGKVSLANKKVQEVNYHDKDQLKSYLLERKMTDADFLLIENLNELLNKLSNNSLSAKDKRIFWIFETSKVDVKSEIQDIKNEGFYIYECPVGDEALLARYNYDLVIYSFSKSENSVQRLKKVVDFLKATKHDIRLIIYTSQHLEDQELNILKDYPKSNYIIANMPSTLISHIHNSFLMKGETNA